MARKTGGNIKDLLFERTTGGSPSWCSSCGPPVRRSAAGVGAALRKFGASFLVTGTWTRSSRSSERSLLYGTVISSTLALLIAVP